MSLLVGVHIDEGRIDLEQTLESLGIDDTVPLTANEKQATVEDLMTARSGIYLPAALEPADVAANRPARGSHAPGTFWFYNNWDFNAVLTVFEQETETKFFDEFERRIAKPLKMETFEAKHGRYQSVESSIHKGYPSWMTAEDLGRVGLLVSRGGKWKRDQIVSEDWIERSTTAVADTGLKGGFGYMWYATIPKKGLLFGAQVQERAFGTAGYGGHYLAVFPTRDLVIVHRVNTIIPDKYWVRDEEFGPLIEKILAAMETP